MEVCKTDVLRIIKYLEDAAALYDRQQGQRFVCRAWMIRRLTKKLKQKLTNHLNIQENDKSRIG